MTHVLAIDAGTTSVRCIAFGHSGEILAVSQRELTQHYPRPGWVEHDADEIWALTLATMAEVNGAVGEMPAAIGITDQRETVVLWDRSSGEPLRRAIVWQDRRTAGLCDELDAAGHTPLVRQTTGLVLDPYFSGTKLAWAFSEGGLEPGPNVAFGTVDSWLVYKLTGGAEHVTDVTNACRTLLFDIRSLTWSDEMCELLGVPRHILAEVRPSSGRLGVTTSEVPTGSGVPISGIAGDQQAALFGQACFEPGMTKNTYGTGSFVLMNTGSVCPEPVDGLLSTVAWTLPSADGSPGGPGGPLTQYAYEGAIFVTGAAIGWMRDELGIIEEAAETGPLAESVPDSGGVFIVPAFTGLGSPWWDPYARGAIFGLSRGSTRAHLARAVVEAMCYSTRDVVDAMSAASGHTVTTLRADGGAAVMDLLLSLQADQLGVSVSRPTVGETTALGAAYLAGLAEGVWSSTDEIAANWSLDAEFHPGGDRPAADAAHAMWRSAVERSMGWAR